MIHSLTGTVLETPRNAIILDTGHNCSYFIHALDCDRVSGFVGCYYVHFHIRQETLNLYGFINPESCQLFKILLSVKGCGPKTALNILNHIECHDFVSAIRQEEEHLLMNIPGLGKRMAAQLFIDLRGKLNDFKTSNTEIKSSYDIILPLVQMGYKQKVCEKVFHSLDHSLILDEAHLLRLMLIELKKVA